MPTKDKAATLKALAEFRILMEEALETTGLSECLLGPDRLDMPNTFTGILGIQIAEFGRSGLSRKSSTAMDEIETTFKQVRT